MVVVRWISLGGVRAAAWWRRLNYRLLLPGLPALLVGGAVVVLSALSLLVPVHELEASYLQQAKALLKSKDYTAALTCYDRLAHFDAKRPEVLFGLAQASAAVGQPERATAILTGLAPPRRRGYGPAHVWVARELLQGPNASGHVDEALTHVLLALEGSLEDRDAAHALLGQLYLHKRNFDAAEEHLLKAVHTRPPLRMWLAKLYMLKGNLERARSEAHLAVSYYRFRTKDDLQDPQFRLGWADAITFLEEFPTAVAILEEGWSIAQAPVYRLALAKVYAAWSEAASRNPSIPPGQWLELLEKGLRHDATNADLLQLMLKAAKMQGPDYEKVRASLHGLLAQGAAPAAVHFVLGADALQRGQTKEARVHLEQAFQLAPQLPAVANNLAWLLLHDAQPDLPRALVLANVALQNAPLEPAYRDTRGRVLAKMGRWQEALGDLVAALPANRNNAELHRTLADVYEHLGVPDMAAEHRRRADPKTAPRKKSLPQEVP
jgi:tetratricopeptide (TPR) repeat protein